MKPREAFKDFNIGDMVGRIVVHLEGGADEDEEMIFTTADGIRFRFYHVQDCCENVRIVDTCGDLRDLIGSPILQADERSDDLESGGYSSQTWTFYTFATIKGSVTVRWLGESNGCYSEAVSLQVRLAPQIFH